MLIKKENGWNRYSDEEKKWAFEFSEYYKKFLDISKTEREFVKNGIAMAEKKGFKKAEEFFRLVLEPVSGDLSEYGNLIADNIDISDIHEVIDDFLSLAGILTKPAKS